MPSRAFYRCVCVAVVSDFANSIATMLLLDRHRVQLQRRFFNLQSRAKSAIPTINLLKVYTFDAILSEHLVYADAHYQVILSSHRSNKQTNEEEDKYTRSLLWLWRWSFEWTFYFVRPTTGTSHFAINWQKCLSLALLNSPAIERNFQKSLSLNFFFISYFILQWMRSFTSNNDSIVGNRPLVCKPSR